MKSFGMSYKKVSNSCNMIGYHIINAKSRKAVIFKNISLIKCFEFN